MPRRSFLLIIANSFNVSLSPSIFESESTQFLNDPCPGKIILSELDIVFKFDVREILTSIFFFFTDCFK